MREPLSVWQSFWILMAFVSVGLAISVWCCRDTRPANAQVPIPHEQPLYVGQVTKLIAGQRLIGINPAACAEIMQLRRAGDHIGLQKMVNDGLILLSDGGTQVRVIDVDLLGEMVRVRILSGGHTGQDGWVTEGSVIHEVR